jgi:hypothetical protein
MHVDHKTRSLVLKLVEEQVNVMAFAAMVVVMLILEKMAPVLEIPLQQHQQEHSD